MCGTCQRAYIKKREETPEGLAGKGGSSLTGASSSSSSSLSSPRSETVSGSLPPLEKIPCFDFLLFAFFLPRAADASPRCLRFFRFGASSSESSAATSVDCEGKCVSSNSYEREKK